MDIYSEVKAMGFEIDYRESDLYVLASPEFFAWWESKGRKVNELRPFRSERDGKIWNEFAFQYTPFWERKAAIYSD